MMEAVRTYETSVYFNVTTRRNIPEDFKLKNKAVLKKWGYNSVDWLQVSQDTIQYRAFHNTVVNLWLL
jgi:hypothetical protein